MMSMFEQRGGEAFARHLNTSFLPSMEILTINYFVLTAVFFISRKGYFIKSELFSSPEGWEFDQDIAKTFKCST